MSGCVSGPKSTETAALPDVLELQIFNGSTGESVPWEAMMQDLQEADVVIIGELHGHRVGLHAAATIWDEVAAEHETAALSMEFFERDEQLGLDDYLADVTDQEAFRTATHRSAGNYPSGHERMIEKAKELRRTVIAANSPRRYNRIANQKGYDSLLNLSEEQRRLFVIPDTLPEGRYHDEFFKIMGGMFSIHGDPPTASETPAMPEPQGKETPEADEPVADVELPTTRPDTATTKPQDGPTSQPSEATQGDDSRPGEAVESEDESDNEMPALTPEQEKTIADMFRSQCMWDATMTDSIIKAADAGHTPVVHVVGQFHVNFGGGIPIRLKSRAPDLRQVTVCVSAEWSDTLTNDDKGKADYVIYVGPDEE